MNMYNFVQIYKTNPDFISQLGGYNMINIDNIMSTDEFGNNILHVSIIKKDNLIINSILNLIKDKPQDTKEKILNSQNNDGDTPAHIATRLNMQEIVKKLDNHGADLEILNNNGESIINEPNNRVVVEEDSVSTDSLFQIINGNNNKESLPNTISSLIDSERYISPTVNKYDSPKFKSPAFLDMLSSNSIDNLFQNKGQSGGYLNNDNTTEADGPSSLSQISSPELDMIQEGGDDDTDGEEGDGNVEGGNDNDNDTDLFIVQNGGSIRGARKIYIHQLSETPNITLSEGGKVKESTLLHDETIQVIKDLGYSEEDAKAIKSKLWSLIKEKYPDLSNMDKSKKLREIAEDKKLLASINPEEVRNMIKKHKEQMESSDNKQTKTKTKTKTKKASTKNTKEKKSKKTSKKASRIGKYKNK